jgi:hypothetical protein
MRDLEGVENDLRTQDWGSVAGGASLHLAMQHRWHQTWDSLIKKVDEELSKPTNTERVPEQWRSFGSAVALSCITALQLASLTSGTGPIVVPRGPLSRWPRKYLPQWRNALSVYLSLALLQTLPLFRFLSFSDISEQLRTAWRVCPGGRSISTPPCPRLGSLEDGGWCVDGPDPMGGVVLTGVTGVGTGRVRIRVSTTRDTLVD